MRIAGLQKLTLLDFPERTAATVFTPGCDYRCRATVGHGRRATPMPVVQTNIFVLIYVSFYTFTSLFL